MADHDIGPKVSKPEVAKVAGLVDRSVAQGAEVLLAGGPLTAGDYGRGHWMSPSVLEVSDNENTIMQEEVFGPVVAAMRVGDFEEAIDHANDTSFGLSAGVFTKDIQRAHRVIAQLQAGTTWINNYNLAPAETPWGGYKHSGIGRENGLAGVESWTQLKSVYVEMGDVDCPYE